MAKHTPANDLADATPLPASFHIEVPSRGRKNARAAIVPPSIVASGAGEAPDYSGLGIPAEAVPALEAARVRLAALGRLETSHVYEYGAVIHEVREAAPDQATFAKWAKKILNLSRRGAENYVAVHRVLGPYRSRVESLCIKPSTLYLMASARPDRIDDLLSQQEAGRKFAVKEVKAILREGSEPEAEKRAVSRGGVAGLKAQIAEKTTCGIAAMMDTAVNVLRAIHIALEPHRRGKKVPKDVTMRPLIHPARLLQKQLESLIWLARPAGDGDQEVDVEPLSHDDDWYKLWEMLEKLGDYEGWPLAADIGTWLSDTVVPQLEWLVGDRAEKAAAVIAEMAKAAIAKRTKSEKKSRTRVAVAKADRGAKATKQNSLEVLSAAVDAINIRPDVDVHLTTNSGVSQIAVPAPR
ncbi:MULTISPECIES: hypothetical protein [Phyllobacteriaceae]|uniref:Uncharacterized protein n=1 Tax=Mesorhizobium hungaricum TaxID=1566387 RepID=A0A1C2DSU3_9HYPH|nr:MULTISPECIES: hypothetical protein [Mesorhizobium]MBN9236353.1 hypothetical protein [Mesorhizobium sp.]MDQ0327744.1 hypothetical protein [Mesorhizobium sp. YL-MeA3-2017]OCX17850.1 hypothetical protein QV13_14165 [Mesorhizobium hungaricum]